MKIVSNGPLEGVGVEGEGLPRACRVRAYPLAERHAGSLGRVATGQRLDHRGEIGVPNVVSNYHSPFA